MSGYGDLDTRLRIARHFLDLADALDREAEDEDSDTYISATLRDVSERIRTVIREEVL